MRDKEFKSYDPFRRQRKKRTGVKLDFTKMYQEHVDKSMIAKIVEAGRRTDRRGGDLDEERIEERAEHMDAQARADTPFAPRDFAAKYAIDLAELGRAENKRNPFVWAPHGSEERQYQEANDALGQKDYEDLMAIPGRRIVLREIDRGIGQPGEEINIDDLGPGSGGGLFPKEPVKEPPEHNVIPMPRVIDDLSDLGLKLPYPMPRKDPGADAAKELLEGGAVIYRPGVEPRRDQPSDGSGNIPVSSDRVFEHPELGRMYPITRTRAPSLSRLNSAPLPFRTCKT